MRVLTGIVLGIALTVAARRYGPAVLWWAFGNGKA